LAEVTEAADKAVTVAMQGISNLLKRLRGLQ
jgi:hypothetical protein